MKLDTEQDCTFDGLVEALFAAHGEMHGRATSAVNRALTLRNWLMGAFIQEYELRGRDRAEYGERLFIRLAERLAALRVPRADARELHRYVAFYLSYPQIRETVSPESLALWPSVRIGETTSPDSPAGSQVVRSPGRDLVAVLAFSHLAELMTVPDGPARAWYEREAISGRWSVRELRRQISTLAFERLVLSTDKRRAQAAIAERAERQTGGMMIRDPYFFEFLGARAETVMGETQLEDALIDKVQAFLFELGRGFCFEARQKRLLIGDELFFIDLVFYHRILKCHVLIDLKVDEFKHQHLGQLNTYVNWYRRNEMGEGDNPPIGLLLCTRKNQALVEYALAGMDNALFVSRYQVQLPRKDELERLLAELSHEVGE